GLGARRRAPRVAAADLERRAPAAATARCSCRRRAFHTGSRRPTRGAPRLRPRYGRRRLGRTARRPVRVLRRRPRADTCRAVRRAHEGRRAALRGVAVLAGRCCDTDAGAPVLCIVAAAAEGARLAPPTARDDEL